MEELNVKGNTHPVMTSCRVISSYRSQKADTRREEVFAAKHLDEAVEVEGDGAVSVAPFFGPVLWRFAASGLADDGIDSGA